MSEQSLRDHLHMLAQVTESSKQNDMQYINNAVAHSLLFQLPVNYILVQTAQKKPINENNYILPHPSFLGQLSRFLFLKFKSYICTTNITFNSTLVYLLVANK